MQSDTLLVLTIIAALGAALNGGIFFAFSTFVMSALRRLPPAQGLAAMQEINITAVTPPFMTALFGTAAVCIAAAVAALVDWSSTTSALVLAGAAVYATGSIAVTAAYNVPRNNDLATVDAQQQDAAARWRRYDREWTGGNHVRTAACMAAAALLIVATRVG